MPGTLTTPTLEDIATQELQGTVRDVMTRDVQTVTPDTSIAHLADVLAGNRLRQAVVVDSREQVLGVVSQRDVLHHFLFGREIDSHGEPKQVAQRVHSLMGDNKPVTVWPSLPLVKAAAVLATNKISCLTVVGQQQRIKGILTVTDLFRHITGHNKETVETRFQLYTPLCDARNRSPAYIRRVNGDLVVPGSGVEDKEMVTDHVVLGYDGVTGRILLKFVEEESQADGTLPVKSDKDNYVIPARGFVSHFGLSGKASAFDVTCHADGNYLVLSPKSAGAKKEA